MADHSPDDLPASLRATIDARLAGLNAQMGRTEDWYSDAAEDAHDERSSHQFAARAKYFGYEAETVRSGAETLEQWARRSVVKRKTERGRRITPWELRSTREFYDAAVAELSRVAANSLMRSPAIVMVEGPTGQLVAQVDLDAESGTYVAIVEEGLLGFGLQMLKVFVSCLPVPEEEGVEAELSIDDECAAQILASGGGGQHLRVFEVMCQFLLGDSTARLEAYPLHPVQTSIMTPIWDCMQLFIVGHEYAHALHGDLRGGPGIVKQHPLDRDGIPFDLVILANLLAGKPGHAQERAHVFTELQADFGASDLLAGMRAQEFGHFCVLLTPLLYLEFIDMLEQCLFRLSYGNDAEMPEFCGNPSPSVRQAYLLAQMETRVDADAYESVMAAFVEVQKICGRLVWPVAHQMHILFRNGVTPHPRWRNLVKRMKPVGPVR